MRFELTEEQRLTRDAVRDYLANEVAPKVAALDEQGFPREVFRGLAELGVAGMLAPEEFGGIDADPITYALVIEEISKVWAALGIIVSVHNSVGIWPILRFGSRRLQEKYVADLAAGRKIGAFALTEAGSGSDAAALRTTAERTGDRYVLNGSKIFVSNGTVGHTFTVMARTSKEGGHRGISAFIVDRDSKGLVVTPPAKKMGIRASDVVELSFQNCEVPAENLIGEEGIGFRIAMIALDNGRIGVGAQALGIAEAALERAVAHAKEREQFGRPIASFQAIQWMIADSHARLEASRHLVYRAAWMKGEGVPFTKEAAMAKLFAAETSTFVAHRAIQVLGGYGYMSEYPTERYYRDARVTEIYEGTSEIQRLVIAARLLEEKP
jgi:alkylation response protein AidB-like acyl-CoA dehydrogenase